MIATQTRKATVAEFEALPEGAPYQLIDFELVMSPAPTKFHNRYLRRLTTALEAYLDERRTGEVIIAPHDVYLTDGDIYQPDILVVLESNTGRSEPNKFYGAPDVVVEALSPSNRRYDLTRKKDVYEQAGVGEYWIIDPIAKTMECLSNSTTGFALTSFAREDGTFESKVLEGFSVKMGRVFTER